MKKCIGASFTVDGILLFQTRQFCSVAYHLVIRDVPLLIHICIISDYALNTLLHIGGKQSTTCGNCFCIKHTTSHRW